MRLWARSLQTTVAYSYVLYDWKQPLYYRLPGPQSYVRFFCRSLLDTYVGVHVHKRGHRQKMIALPPLNLNIILQVSPDSSYCILIVSRQKQSILVVKSGNLFTNNHNSYLVLHNCILISIIITILAADCLKNYQLPGFVRRVKSEGT